MKRSRKTLPELPRIYVPPVFDTRQRQAMRAWWAASAGGEHKRPSTDTVDPLQLRMGLRCCLMTQRAGWVVSNPGYSDTLDRVPALDPSLPGPAWLRFLYRWHERRTFACLLPTVRELLERRLLSLQRPKAGQQRANVELAAVTTPATENMAAMQADLFACTAEGGATC